MDYINEQSRPEMIATAERLSAYYQSQGSWENLRGNYNLWVQLTTGEEPYDSNNSSAAPAGGMAPRPSSRPQIEFEVPNGDSLLTEPLEVEVVYREPAPRPPPSRDPTNPQSLLLDINNRPVIGLRDLSNLEEPEIMREEVRVDEQIIGYFIYPKRNRITAAVDQNFAASLDRSMLIIIILAGLVCLPVSLLFARNISRPVTALSNATGELSKGNYSARTQVDRGDELGDLAENFNRLASVLQANQHSQQRWVADISHELRTPLAVIQSEIHAVEDGIRPLDNTTLVSLTNEIERFSRLINDLYDLSRAEAGDLSYRMERITVRDMLQQAADSFSQRYEQKGIQLRLLDVSSDMHINADPIRITQLFSNLLENSLRYTDSPGVTEIQCEPISKKEISIYIQDSAPGVPQTELTRIFERLYRLEKSRAKVYGGGGLGLALCETIVKAHDGEISAKSSELGGLGIEIRLPLVS